MKPRPARPGEMRDAGRFAVGLLELRPPTGWESESSMEELNLLLVGCGMMGARHVRGFAELERVAPGSVRLVAVCDRREDAANAVAAEADELLGYKPQSFVSIEDALASGLSVDAADLVTDPRSHDELAVQLMEAGLHVMCEKPLALTVARGRRMVEAAQRTGRVLAVAENNRRDPMNRLCRACIQSGLIGEPNFALQLSVNPASGIIATAWRHRLAMGGVMLDVAVHVGYILEYLLGPIDSVTARAALVMKHREGKRFDGRQVRVEADAEDVFAALLGFSDGTIGHWTCHFASPGETAFKRLIIGSEGTLNCPSDRSGKSPSVHRGREVLTGDGLVAEVADYRLNDIETRLFGERPASYELDGPVTDRKLIAAEMYDFVEAVRMGRPPEADGSVGLRSVAIIYSILESAHSGQPVDVEGVLAGRIHAYQDRAAEALL